MPTWYAPITWATDDVPTATQFNQFLRDDLLYLLNRPSAVVLRDNGGVYTTTSTSFANIDGANLSIALSIAGSAVLLGFTGAIYDSANIANAQVMLDFTVDGARVGAAGLDGLLPVRTSPNATGIIIENCSFGILVTGLSAGSHTFKVQWRRVSASCTPNLISGGGSSPTDSIVGFWAAEVG